MLRPQWVERPVGGAELPPSSWSAMILSRIASTAGMGTPAMFIEPGAFALSEPKDPPPPPAGCRGSDRATMECARHDHVEIELTGSQRVLRGIDDPEARLDADLPEGS